MKGILYLGLIFFSFFSEARVFNFKSEYLASYLRATGGMSRAGDQAFGDSSGVDTTFEDEVAYNFSGEIGFLLMFKDRVTFRVGVELLETKPLVEVPGSDASGTALFALNSQAIVLQPVGTFEFNIMPKPDSRLFFYLGGGLAELTLENSYVMTADGETSLAQTDFTEKLKSRAWSGHGGIGYEMLMADTVTVSFDLGYRYLPFSELKFKEDSSTLTQGAAVSNDVALTNSGDKRILDMSGPYFALTFRFYIDFNR